MIIPPRKSDASTMLGSTSFQSVYEAKVEFSEAVDLF
jgi:hypothetical protein